MKTYGDISSTVAGYLAARERKIYSAPPDPIESATDDTLVLELIKRGYAVGRLNDKNQLDV